MFIRPRDTTTSTHRTNTRFAPEEERFAISGMRPYANAVTLLKHDFELGMPPAPCYEARFNGFEWTKRRTSWVKAIVVPNAVKSGGAPPVKAVLKKLKRRKRPNRAVHALLAASISFYAIPERRSQSLNDRRWVRLPTCTARSNDTATGASQMSVVFRPFHPPEHSKALFRSPSTPYYHHLL